MKHRLIKINYDFTEGNEISYVEGKMCRTSFATHCTSFFSFDVEAWDVLVVKRNGTYISRNELLKNNGKYTSKEIRHAHNIEKMLLAGAFSFSKVLDTCLFDDKSKVVSNIGEQLDLMARSIRLGNTISDREINRLSLLIYERDANHSIPFDVEMGHVQRGLTTGMMMMQNLYMQSITNKK